MNLAQKVNEKSLLSRKSTAKKRYGSRFSVFGSPFSVVLPIFARYKIIKHQ
jgi:hypothetical protein